MADIDEVNILFIGNGSCGKTTIISGICNKIYGSIKKFCGTKRIAIYNTGSIPSFFKNDMDHYIVNDLDIDIPNVNIIDTVGYYKNENDVVTDTFISTMLNNIDLVVCVIDVNVPFDKNIIKKYQPIENVLFVINKCDDLINDSDIKVSIKEITDDICNKNVVCVSADNILCCKSILKNFSTNIPGSKLKVFDVLFNIQNNDPNELLLKLDYNKFILKIKELLPVQSIFDNKIKKYIDGIDTIKDLIELSKKYSVSSKAFNKNLSIVVGKCLNDKSNTLDRQEKKNKLLSGVSDDIEYIKNNTTLQHYIAGLLNVDTILSDSVILQMASELSKFDIVCKKIFAQLLNLHIDGSNVKNVIKYLLLLNRDVLINNITMIDEISFTLMKHLLPTITDVEKLIVITHIDMYFELYSKFLPITCKIKYYRLEVSNDVIMSNTQSLVSQRIDILNFFDKIFNNKPVDLVSKKNNMIIKLLNEKFALFPCADKYPLCKKWNYIDNSKSYKMKDKLITKNIGLVCGELSNIFIIDIDQKDDGMEYWNMMLNQYNNGIDIDTLKVNTANNGKHYYFKLDDDIKLLTTKNKIFSTTEKKIGIDVRNNSGYVIMPYSVLETDKMYKFENYDENKTFREQIKNVPEWLKKCLNIWYEKNDCKCEIIDDESEFNKEDEDPPLNNNFDNYHDIFKSDKLTKYQSFIAICNDIRISVSAKNASSAVNKAATIFHKISGDKLKLFNIQLIKQMPSNRKIMCRYISQRYLYSKPVKFIDKNNIERTCLHYNVSHRITEKDAYGCYLSEQRKDIDKNTEYSKYSKFTKTIEKSSSKNTEYSNLIKTIEKSWNELSEVGRSKYFDLAAKKKF